MVLFGWLAVCAIALISLFISYLWHANKAAKKEAALTLQLEQALLHEKELQNQLAIIQESVAARRVDHVTQLISWPMFMERVDQRLAESARFQFTLALLTIELMDFQIFVNALGSDVTNAILSEVAQRFQGTIRQVDFVSRGSNNQFAVLLTKLNKPEVSAIVVQRLLNTLIEPINVNGKAIYVSAYVGIAIYPIDGAESAVLFGKSEQALQRAKEKGGGAYQYYQESMDSTSQYELALVTDLKRETLFQELKINYQPLVYAQTETLFCLRTSLEWYHPELGIIDYFTLIQCAEKLGKFNAIFEWLLRVASQYFVQHQQEMQAAFLSVPLPLHQLNNSQFIYQLSQILRAGDFNSEKLILEISLDTLSTPIIDIEKSLNMLRYLNIKLAVRDFGVNNVSIQQLQQWGIHYLYLHPGMIKDLQNTNTQATVKALVALADSLSMQLLIEGVSAREEIDLLRSLGCQVLQQSELVV